MYRFNYKGILIFGKIAEDIFCGMNKEENEFYDKGGIDITSRLWLGDGALSL